MAATRRSRLPISLAGTILLAVAGIGVGGRTASAQATPPKPKILAQHLVEAAKAAHPEADEIGISTTTKSGCVGIASTDASDVGEKCEADDSRPMQTGKPSVGKEEGGYDVSVPLHDAAGKVVGVLGVGFKAAAGQTAASVTTQAEKIARELAAKIHSKADLFVPSN